MSQVRTSEAVVRTAQGSAFSLSCFAWPFLHQEASSPYLFPSDYFHLDPSICSEKNSLTVFKQFPYHFDCLASPSPQSLPSPPSLPFPSVPPSFPSFLVYIHGLEARCTWDPIPVIILPSASNSAWCLISVFKTSSGELIEWFTDYVIQR